MGKNNKNAQTSAPVSPETAAEGTTAPATETTEGAVDTTVTEGEGVDTGAETTGAEEGAATEGEASGETAPDGETTGETATEGEAGPVGADSSETATADAPPAAPPSNIVNIVTGAPEANKPEDQVQIITQTAPLAKDTPISSAPATDDVTDIIEVDPVDAGFYKASILVSVWKSNLRQSHGYRSVSDVIDLVTNRSDNSTMVQVESADIKTKLDVEIDNINGIDTEAVKVKIFYK